MKICTILVYLLIGIGFASTHPIDFGSSIVGAAQFLFYMLMWPYAVGFIIADVFLG